jgi:hypothetical protein
LLTKCSQDPGSAPVLGERVRYVVTQNGSKQVSAKAEPLEQAVEQSLVIDRHFYLAAFRKAVEGIFFPIIEQRLFPEMVPQRIKKEAERMLWQELLEERLLDAPSKRANSAIARAFLKTPTAEPDAKRAKKTTGTGLASNAAERAQMTEREVKKKQEINDKRKTMQEQSPLLKAFARQTALQSTPK